MTLNQRILLFFFLLFIPLILIWSFQKKFVQYSGEVMGTTFSIKLYAPIWVSKLRVINEVNTVFANINSTFSTWDDNSEISLFNKNTSLEPIIVSDEFAYLTGLSTNLYSLSAGAFDPTIMPLLTLWGFNSQNSYYKIPNSELVEFTSSFVGFDKLSIHNNTITKQNEKLTLDYSSIAKGYSVDAVASVLKELGISDFMIEVGGEILVSTPSYKPNKVWKLGIVRPSFNYSNQDLYITLKLKDKALATSGDYRNYFIENDIAYSHLFDPRLGMPISSNVASVSVIADSCAYADGLATAIMVLGKERGIALVEALDNVEAMIVERKSINDFVTFYSSNFNRYIQN